MPQDRITRNQVAYLAAEATYGVKPSAGAFRDLMLMIIERDIALDMQEYQGQGRRFKAGTRSNKDYTNGKSSGDASYTELIYPHSSHWGIVTPTAVASANVAKDWKWPISLAGAITPQSYWLQFGETASRVDEWGGAVFSGTTVKFSRNGPVTAESPFFGQALNDGATFVSTPPMLPATKIMGKSWSLARDPSAGALGATILTRECDAEFAYTGGFKPWFASNRASNTVTVPIDDAVKAQLNITLEADAQGMTVLSDARAGIVEYYRLFSQGDPIEAQTILTVSGTPTGGTFSLTINGQTASGLAFSISSAALQTALQALTSVGTNVTAAGGPFPGTPITLTFSGPLALGPVLSHVDAFTGGASPALAIGAFTFFNHQYTADLACSLAGDIKYGDSDGIYAVTYIFDLIEDLVWGNAGLVTVRNGRSTL